MRLLTIFNSGEHTLTVFTVHAGEMHSLVQYRDVATADDATELDDEISAYAQGDAGESALTVESLVMRQSAERRPVPSWWDRVIERLGERWAQRKTPLFPDVKERASIIHIPVRPGKGVQE